MEDSKNTQIQMTFSFGSLLFFVVESWLIENFQLKNQMQTKTFILT